MAGSEGFLTGGRRGLDGREVVWGEMDSFVSTYYSFFELGMWKGDGREGERGGKGLTEGRKGKGQRRKEERERGEGVGRFGRKGKGKKWMNDDEGRWGQGTGKKKRWKGKRILIQGQYLYVAWLGEMRMMGDGERRVRMKWREKHKGQWLGTEGGRLEVKDTEMIMRKEKRDR